MEDFLAVERHVLAKHDLLFAEQALKDNHRNPCRSTEDKEIQENRLAELSQIEIQEKS